MSAAVLAAIGGGINIGGQLFAGLSARKRGRRIARMKMAMAADAIERGELNVNRVKMRGKQIIGEQRAALAVQGVDVNVGSALDVQADTSFITELDVLTTRNNAKREAWGYQFEAREAKRAGREALIGSVLGAAGSAFSTGTNVSLLGK